MKNLILSIASIYRAARAIVFTVARTGTAGNYEIVRTSNGLQINVPTNKKITLSVNAVEAVSLTASLLKCGSAVLLEMGNYIQFTGTTNAPAGSITNIVRQDNILLYNVADTYSHKFRINRIDRLVLSPTGLQVVDDLEIDGDLNHDGTNVGLYGVTPAAQATKISDPTGGATTDAEARTAINAIIDALEAIGISAAA